jgi:hypothetical protein
MLDPFQFLLGVDLRLDESAPAGSNRVSARGTEFCVSSSEIGEYFSLMTSAGA